MTATHKNFLKTTISAVASAGLGAFTISTASSGYRTFGAGDDGLTFDGVTIKEGTAWEVRDGCVYTHSGTSLSRGTLQDSSTGSAIAFTSAAVVQQGDSAGLAELMELAMASVMPGGRLTLVSGVPVDATQNAVAVSGQDTSADTVTATAHGWIAGQVLVSSATSGGLSIATTYYAGNITTNTISLHTTAAAALAGTSKVDITGAVSATLTAQGIAGSSVYYTPFAHNVVPLWDGYKWVPVEFTEKTLTLSGLTSGKPHDVFGYLSAGALVLEALVWTDDTTRATAVTLQDGRYCKSGDKTRLLLGTFYTTGTTTTEDSAANRYVNNVYNQILRKMSHVTLDGGHTYNVGTGRAYNNSTAHRVNFLGSLAVPAQCIIGGIITAGAANATGDLFLGFDSTTTGSSDSTGCSNGNTSAVRGALGGTIFAAPGKHFFQIVERGNATTAVTFAYAALAGGVFC